MTTLDGRRSQMELGAQGKLTGCNLRVLRTRRSSQFHRRWGATYARMRPLTQRCDAVRKYIRSSSHEARPAIRAAGDRCGLVGASCQCHRCRRSTLRGSQSRTHRSGAVRPRRCNARARRRGSSRVGAPRAGTCRREARAAQIGSAVLGSRASDRAPEFAHPKPAPADTCGSGDAAEGTAKSQRLDEGNRARCGRVWQAP